MSTFGKTDGVPLWKPKRGICGSDSSIKFSPPKTSFVFGVLLIMINAYSVISMYKETIEHIIIECQHCNEAWLFVENIVKNYLKNRNLYLFDRNIILGVNIKNDVVLLLIGKLLKTIWNIRCSVARKGCNDYINIQSYARNRALCYLNKDKLKFTF